MDARSTQQTVGSGFMALGAWLCGRDDRRWQALGFGAFGIGLIVIGAWVI
jgi:hypothetical protein